jgi:hypothetical protein
MFTKEPITKIFGLTRESHRTRRRRFFLCREISASKKASCRREYFIAKGLSFIENRHLLILYDKSPSPCLERVTLWRQEWAVKMGWDADYLPLLATMMTIISRLLLLQGFVLGCPQAPGRVADHDGIVWNMTQHDRSHTNKTVVSYRNGARDAGVCSNIAGLADSDIPRNTSPARDEAVISHHIIVTHNAPWQDKNMIPHLDL